VMHVANDIGVVSAVLYDVRDALAHGAEIIIIPHDKGAAAGWAGDAFGRPVGRDIATSEEIIELPFPFLYSFGSTETFQVGLAGIGDDAMCREGVFTIPFYFLLVIGAHFDDGKLGILLHGQDGEGNADVIIQIALGGIGDMGGGEDGVYQLLRRGLPIAAGDGYKRDLELTAMVEGQPLQGGEHVFHEDELIDGYAVACGGFVDDGIGGALFQGLAGESVAIEAGAFQGKEKIALPELAGICLYGRVAEEDLIKLVDSHGQI